MTVCHQRWGFLVVGQEHQMGSTIFDNTIIIVSSVVCYDYCFEMYGSCRGGSQIFQRGVTFVKGGGV